VSKTIRAAVVQTVSIAYQPEATIEHLAELAAEAGQNGAQLAVFPEAFIGGYPKGATFDTPVGYRTPEGRESYQAYFDGAIEVPGSHTRRLEEIANSYSLPKKEMAPRGPSRRHLIHLEESGG